MSLADYTVTEAGFGADLGAEKFMNIKCRSAGISPNAVVIVATVRALKHHGGVALADLGKPNVEALDKGVENLKKHIENIHRFGLPVVVAINSFLTDTDDEIQFIKDKCAYLSVQIIQAEHWAKGSVGAEALARAVVDVAENTKTDFTLLYPNTCSLWDKVGIICREIYGATEVLADKRLRNKFKRLQEEGYGELPICMAKTQYSPFHGSGAERAAEEIRRSAARRAGLGGRRIRGRSHGRHHDHAGAPQSAGGREHRHQRKRRDHRAVLSGPSTGIIPAPPKMSASRCSCGITRMR